MPTPRLQSEDDNVDIPPFAYNARVGLRTSEFKRIIVSLTGLGAENSCVFFFFWFLSL